jgi:5-methylcytosine-specific restriction endonuclease McrA
MRECIKCKEAKPLTEFYWRSDKGDYRNDCKACFILMKKANYRAKAPEKRANQRAYYAENREAQLAWHKAHQPVRYDTNRERILAARKQEKAALMALPEDHPRRVRTREKQRERNRRRALRESLVAGSGVSEREWGALLKKYHHACAYCFSKGNIGMDHVVPIARGGADDATNVVPCCRECNSSKGAKTVMEWIARLELRMDRILSRQKAAA